MATRVNIDDFARQIGGQGLGLVEHRPEDGMSPTMCFGNVVRKIARDGGRARYGWMFQVKHPEHLQEAEYLNAIHHAVWNGPDGQLIDVTPFHVEARHHPVTQNGSIVFLWDPEAEPVGAGDALVTLPIKFFPIGEDPALLEHIRTLRRDEYQRMQAIRQAAAAVTPGTVVENGGNAS